MSTYRREDICKKVKYSTTMVEKKAILCFVLEAIKKEVKENGRIKIRNFGSFYAQHKSERMGRNPKTKIEAVISERKRMAFRRSFSDFSKYNPKKEYYSTILRDHIIYNYNERFTVDRVRQVLNDIFRAIITLLRDDKSSSARIELRGFGVFEKKIREAHIARNPYTGEKVKVPSKKVLHFRQSGKIKEMLND